MICVKSRTLRKMCKIVIFFDFAPAGGVDAAGVAPDKPMYVMIEVSPRRGLFAPYGGEYRAQRGEARQRVSALARQRVSASAR